MIPSRFFHRGVLANAVFLFSALAVSGVSITLVSCGGNSTTGGQTGTPQLAATVTTQGNFSSGQQNATYQIQVKNTGTGATSGTVTVVDPPTGFTVTAMAGTNWSCTLATTTCTYGASVSAGQTFPAITVTGNVTAANGTPVSIALSLSGGGIASPVNSTPTVMVTAPVLSVAKTHMGSFAQGQQGASYTVTVSNGASAGATNAKVTVTETVPSGETLVSMAGAGWTCPGAGGANTCDRSDMLATGASYPAITVTVNVAATAASPQLNQVSVSGGGTMGSVSTSDPTTVTAPTIATISVSPSSPSIGIGGTQQFTATARDGNGNVISGVTFTWASSATTIASISMSGLATGLSAGTAQITASASGVTSPQDPLTVTSTIACGSGSESLLSGQYALLLRGFDSAGNPALVGGVLTFNGANDNGGITAGVIDMNLNSGVQTNLSVISGGYGVGSDQRGCMAITTSAGTQNYRLAVSTISSGVASEASVIGFDQGGPFVAGILRRQTPAAFSTAQVSGNYAFGVSAPQNIAQCNGATPPVCGGASAAAGVLDLSAGSVAGGQVDVNFNGELDGDAMATTWPATPLPFASGGTYTISSTTGRGTASFSLNVSGASPINAVLYVVTATDVLIMSSDSQTSATGNTIFAGELQQQSGAPFAANPLSGNYVGYDSGLGSTNTGRTDLYLAGPLTSGSNAISNTFLRNDGGTYSSAVVSGTYSVSPAGRMIISEGGRSPVIYLVDNSRGFFLRSNLSVDEGLFEAQNGSPFSSSSASGIFAQGTIDPQNVNDLEVSGAVTVTPATNNIHVVLDGNNNGGSPMFGQVDLTYSIDSTGLGMIPSSCSVSIAGSTTTCDTLFYIISPTKIVVMDTQATRPRLLLLRQ